MNTAEEDLSGPAEEGLGLFGVAKKLGRWILAFCGVAAIAFVALYYFLMFDLIRAARVGNYNAVAAAVAWSPDIVNQRLDGGGTLLYAAAAGDQADIVEFLLESGADPDLPTGNSGGCPPDRPVHAAAERGSTQAMKLLADAGADLNVVGNCFGESPIIMAAENGHIEVVRFLLDAGVDPNSNSWHASENDPEVQLGFTTLEEAAIKGHADVVKLLLERGAKVQYVQNDRQETALHTFCFMLPLRVDPNARYERWLRNMPTIIDLLVKGLGDVNFPDGAGNTCLHEAVEISPVHPEEALRIVRYLVENYPTLDVNAPNGMQETPLHQAVAIQSVPAVKYLLENCPQLNVNPVNEFGYIPLRKAQRNLRWADREEYRERLKQIIKLLESHSGRVDEEAEKRAREARRVGCASQRVLKMHSTLWPALRIYQSIGSSSGDTKTLIERATPDWRSIKPSSCSLITML